MPIWWMDGKKEGRDKWSEGTAVWCDNIWMAHAPCLGR